MTGKNTVTKVQEGNSLFCVRAFGNDDLAALLSLTAKDALVGMRNVRISAVNSLFNKNSLVCAYRQENINLAHIAISDTRIVACNTAMGNLTVYDSNGDELFTLGSGKLQRPWGVILLGDYSVLVTDTDTGMLYKYKLEAGAKPMWVCQNLQSPTGICVDADENIYVASNAGRRIYLVSPEGEYGTYTCIY